MKVEIFYLDAGTSKETAQRMINKWLKHHNNVVTIHYIFQTSEDENTVISIWYKESTHVI